MQSLRIDLWQKTSFCTCSYLKSVRDYRASIVYRAMQGWHSLLKLPFAEKIFLDDSSPDFNGMRMLKYSNKLNDFDSVRYNTMLHPPHSNFGILMSMSLCKGEYIMHVDDDVKVSETERDCLNFLEHSLIIMQENKDILGINLMTPDFKSENTEPWTPGKDYPNSNTFAHPKKYFGTAVCLIRRELLEKVSLADIFSWGSQQPNTWEQLVSDDTSSFLVSKVATPFTIEYDSWLFNSTSEISTLGKYKYLSLKKLGFLKIKDSLTGEIEKS